MQRTATMPPLEEPRSRPSFRPEPNTALLEGAGAPPPPASLVSRPENMKLGAPPQPPKEMVAETQRKSADVGSEKRDSDRDRRDFGGSTENYGGPTVSPSTTTGYIHDRSWLREQYTNQFARFMDMRSSPGVMLLGLCTTTEIREMPAHLRETLWNRLRSLLLKRTTENTTPVSHGEYLSEGFECSTLDAFEYAGLNIAPRVWISPSGPRPEEGGMPVIGKDVDVGALNWARRVKNGEGGNLDFVAKRCVELWENSVRSRLMGMPVSGLWKREQLWRTVTAVIAYIECLDAR